MNRYLNRQLACALMILCFVWCALPASPAGLTISSVKAGSDNPTLSVGLFAKTVTYASTDFFYIEEDDRSAGIRVEKMAHGLSQDIKVDVIGTIATDGNGERYILATSAVASGSVNTTPNTRVVSVINRPVDSPAVVGHIYYANPNGNAAYTITGTVKGSNPHSATVTGVSPTDWGNVAIGDVIAGAHIANGTRVLSKPTSDTFTISDYTTDSFDGATTITGVGEVGYTSRKHYVTSVMCQDLRVAFVNVKTTAAPLGAAPNVVTVKAWIEYGPAPTIYPLTFNGSPSVTIAGGGEVWTDTYSGQVFNKGTDFWIRTYVSAPAGGEIASPYGQTTLTPISCANPPTVTDADDATFGEFSTAWTNKKVINGIYYQSPYFYGAEAIQGTALTAIQKPVFGVLGDSISCVIAQLHNVYPNQTWFSEVFKSNDVIYAEVSNNGDYAWNAAANTDAIVEPILNGIDVLICALGRNDLTYNSGTDADSLAKLEADYVTVWNRYASKGIKVYQTTITPYTQSTDGWVDVINQVLPSGTYKPTFHGDSRPLNDRLRTIPAPLSGIIDIAPSVMDPDMGVWKAGYTYDGVHQTVPVAQDAMKAYFGNWLTNFLAPSGP